MERFFLKIDAESPDGVEVNQTLDVKIKCSKDLAVGVLVHTIKKNDQIKNMLLLAVEQYLNEKIEEKAKLN